MSRDDAPCLPNVDDSLRAEIARYTQIDEDIWSSPNRGMRDSVHAFFQYPAMMIPAIQRNLVNAIISVQPEVANILDPFVGAGTTLTTAMYAGLDCYGQDINPLAVLLSRTKTGPFFYDSLVRRTQETILAASVDTSRELLVDFTYLKKWFRRDVAIELSRLKRAIQSEDQIWARRFMWVALAETVRLTSNDRTSTYKLHVRPSDEIANRALSPIEVFANLISQNLDDLLEFKKDLEQAGYVSRGRFTSNIEVVLGDTAEGVILPNGNEYPFCDLLVTSPPYGDNTSTITYGEHSYLPLNWIDLRDISPGADEFYLRTTKEIDRRSLGGKRSRKLAEQIEELRSESEALAEIFDALAGKPRDRSSRVAAFYSDFIESLDHIVSVMRMNAYMVWIVGNRHVGGIEIPNDRILIELLQGKSVQFVTQIQRRIHQKRMPPRNKISRTMRQEKILVFRKTT